MNPQQPSPTNLWNFALRERLPLAYGLNFSFLSSFGQTFLISLFVPHFINSFGLTNAGFGTIYSLLTLTSAAVIPVLGGLIDSTSLNRYGLLVITGLILGATTTAVSWHLAVLIVGLFLLRLSGQGLSTHTANTAIGRHYDQQVRGKALSIVNLGLPVGEGILPLTVTALLATFPWRWTMACIGVTVLLIFLPVQFLLLENSGLSEATDDSKPGDDNLPEPNQFSVYWSVIRELRFWLLLPAVLLPGFWITGLFLYQTTLAEQLDWSVQLLATGFVGYGISRIICSLGVGPLIDRWSARVLFPFYLIPFGLALVLAYYHPGAWSAFAYMGLMGITMGTSTNLKTALWAELYGRNVLGRIRALFSSLMVFSTSLSPFLMGWLLDAGYTVETILFWAVVTVLVATPGAFLGGTRS